MIGGRQVIPGALVRYLRRGVRRQMQQPLDVLRVQVFAADPRPGAFGEALERFDEACALVEIIGISEAERDEDVEVDLDRWPRLVLKALESEYQAEVERLEDASAEGTQLLSGDVPALGRLVREVREKVKPAPARRSVLPRLKRQRGPG